MTTLTLRLLASLTLSVCLIESATAIEWFGRTLDGRACEGGGQAFGPYDYFDVNEEGDALYQEGRLWEARWRHFDRGLRHLNADPFLQPNYQNAEHEFDYMLRAYPNHPDVLRAIIDLEFRKRQNNDAGQSMLISRNPPPECYFQRAIEFRPDHTHIYTLYGLYLHRLKRYEAAVEQYDRALEIDAKNAEVNYNAGLAHLKLSNYDASRMHAEKAYAAGYPLPGLRRQLERAGKW